MIVMPDCILENAVEGAVWSAFATAGQRRTCLANLLVHKDIYMPFRQAFLEAVERLPIGNPVSHPDVFYGPLINAKISKAFEEHWATGEADGATLVTGGARFTEENRTERVRGAIAKGHYQQPCVWEGVTPQMRIFQEEILGPTVNLCRVEDFDEAIAWANAAPYGLSSAIYTENRTWIERFKQEIRAGISAINTGTTGTEAHVPYGGTGWSGNGTLEEGTWALEAYTRWHVVTDDSSRSLQKAQEGEDYASRHAYDKSNWDRL
jgi:aldehyde dehydrogenase (NAD+)